MNKFSRKILVSLILLTGVSGCSIIPRNLSDLEEDVKWISYTSTMGAELRAPHGVNGYLFRLARINRKLMVGGGLDFANVMVLRDSKTYISLLSPYVYYSPVGIAEPNEIGPNGPIGVKARIITYLYAGGSFLAIPRSYKTSDPSKVYFDFGVGLTYKRLDFRAGALYKYRKSTAVNSLFYFGGVNYTLFGGGWKLNW